MDRCATPSTIRLHAQNRPPGTRLVLEGVIKRRVEQPVCQHTEGGIFAPILDCHRSGERRGGVNEVGAPPPPQDDTPYLAAGGASRNCIVASRDEKDKKDKREGIVARDAFGTSLVGRRMPGQTVRIESDSLCGGPKYPKSMGAGRVPSHWEPEGSL